MGSGKRIKGGKDKKEEEKQMSFKIKPVNSQLTFAEIGDYIIRKLEEQGFKLDYNDVDEGYSTIDFLKRGRKYNVLLVPEGDNVKCEPSIRKLIVPFLIGMTDKAKQSSFENLVRNIIITSQDMELVN